MREVIHKQATEVRKNISAQAEADGLKVVATPGSGSFAKHTGLRRHMRGDVEIEGQDVDVPFVVKPSTTDGERITELLRRFDQYAATSYPNTPRTVTGSSVELRFAASKLNYDLVPMLTSHHPDYQIILKKSGDRRLTSVSKHTEFVLKRTQQSDSIAGRVKFNECVRLIKWWRYVRISSNSPIQEVRTMLIELLCANAYDKFSVEQTYTETLLKWFSWLANVTASRARVEFSDFTSIEPFNKAEKTNALWQVIDPVSANNNVVHSDWGNIELQAFAAWFAESRDALSRLIAQDMAGNDSNVDAILSQTFGKAVLAHGGE
jgi:hypothetical protein